MKKIISIILVSLVSLLLGGCGGEELKTLLTFHVGTNVMGLPETAARELIEMPSTNFRLMCSTDIFMYNGDIERVDVARVDSGGIRIDGLYFKCTVEGAKKLLNITASNLNNFIVMKINGKPVGLRKIDTVIPDGMLFVIADGPKQEELQKIADEINESILVTNRIKADL